MISDNNEIQMYMHCKHCIEEKPAAASPQEWQKVQVGFTKVGLQIWCTRHNTNICHIDFQGTQHPANTGEAIKSEKKLDETMGDDQMMGLALCMLLEDRPGFGIPVMRIADSLDITHHLKAFWDMRHAP